MTERTCETCAWYGFSYVEKRDDRGLCHFSPKMTEVHDTWWCRHWAATTGWDRVEEMPTPLEKQMSEILQKVITEGPVSIEEFYQCLDDMQAWLEEYKRKC